MRYFSAFYLATSSTDTSSTTQSSRARRRAAAKQRQKELKEREAQIIASLGLNKDKEEEQQTSSENELPLLESVDGTDKMDVEKKEDTTIIPSTTNKSTSSLIKKETDTEYIIETPVIDFDNPAFSEMKRIYDWFLTPKEENTGIIEEKEEIKEQRTGENKKNESSEDSLMNGNEKQLSRRQLKLQNRLNIAELKQLVTRPDVVELHDANSADPKLLVALKSYRNSKYTKN